jgi:hypothetical protein
MSEVGTSATIGLPLEVSEIRLIADAIGVGSEVAGC